MVPAEGNPEVNQLEVQTVLAKEEDVFGLEISMGDVMVVAVEDSFEDLLENHPGVSLAEFIIITQFFEKLAARTEAKWLNGYSWMMAISMLSSNIS